MSAPSLADVLASDDSTVSGPSTATRTEFESPTLDDVLNAPNVEVAPQTSSRPLMGKLRAGALSAADTVAFGKQTGAAMRTIAASNLDDYTQAQAGGGLAGLAGGEDTSGFNPLERYRAERGALQGSVDQARADQPGASAVGTGLGIGAQLVQGNPRNAITLGRQGFNALRAAPAAIRAAVSNPRAAFQGAKAGIQAAAGPGAFQGALQGLSSSPADLTRGEVGPAALDTVLGAGYGTVLSSLLGATLGGGAGALEARAGKLGAKASTSQTLDELAAAREAQPADAEAAKQTANRRLTESAEAEARNPTRDKALRLSGLRTLKGEDTNATVKRAEALFDEPTPEGSGSLLVEMGKLPPRERLTAARRLREETGAVLGATRRKLSEEGAGVEGKVLLERLSEAYDAPTVDLKGEAAVNTRKVVVKAIKKAIDKKTGKLTAQKLQDLADELSDLSAYDKSKPQGSNITRTRKVYRIADKVLQDEQTALVRTLDPQGAPQFERALSKYGLYKDLERGSRNIAERAPDNLVGQGVQYGTLRTPTKVTSTAASEVPQFPGGDEAEAAAEASLAPSRLKRALVELTSGGAGAAAGGMAGAAVGLPRVGARLGGSGGSRIARAWYGRVAPTAKLRAKSEGAIRSLERFAPIFQAALSKGPQAVAALHKSLRETVPEYAAVFTAVEAPVRRSERPK